MRIHVRGHTLGTRFLTAEQLVEEEGGLAIDKSRRLCRHRQGHPGWLSRHYRDDKHRIAMARDFFDINFVDRWECLPAELRSMILSYAPLPACPPRILSVGDLLEEMRNDDLAVWHQLVHYGIDFSEAQTEHGAKSVRGQMRASSFGPKSFQKERCANTSIQFLFFLVV